MNFIFNLNAFSWKRCSEPRPALMPSFRVVTSFNLQPAAASGVVADLVSR